MIFISALQCEHLRGSTSQILLMHSRQVTELDYLFGVTTWAKPAAATGKGQQVLMVTVRTTNTSEPMFQVTALEICIDKISNYLSVKAVAAAELRVIRGNEARKFIGKQFV